MTRESCQQGQTENETQREMEEQALRNRMRNIRQKILVLSGKGGVGKSTVAANLAAALASAGQAVGLLDVDVHGPSIPKLLGLEGRNITVSGNEMLPVRLNDQLAVMSIGFLLHQNTDAVIWRGPRKFHVIRQFLKDVAWDCLDYLVVDSPPGTGDEPMSVAQLVGEPAAAIIVTTPQDVAISDVRRCVSFCRALSLPMLGILENMSGFVCPACGERIDLFKSGGGKALADEMDVPFLGQIPIEPAIVTSGDGGTPFISNGTSTPAGQVFAEIVKLILDCQGHGDASDDTQIPQQQRCGMTIAIPLVRGHLTSHFGHCEEFAILRIDEQNKQILGKSTHKPPDHEPGVLPRWLHEHGVKLVIAGGMGQRAQQLLEQHHIATITGASADTPEQLASAYLSGTLHTGDNVCDH